jgi:hypothetical protein
MKITPLRNVLITSACRLNISRNNKIVHYAAQGCAAFKRYILILLCQIMRKLVIPAGKRVDLYGCRR